MNLSPFYISKNSILKETNLPKSSQKSKNNKSKSSNDNNIISQMIITSYDKVLIYLKEIQSLIDSLNSLNDKTNYISKIKWIIETIQSQTNTI